MIAFLCACLRDLFVLFLGGQADDEGMDRLQGSLVQAAIKRLVKEFKSKVRNSWRLIRAGTRRFFSRLHGTSMEASSSERSFLVSS